MNDQLKGRAVLLVGTRYLLLVLVGSVIPAWSRFEDAYRIQRCDFPVKTYYNSSSEF